MHDAHAGADSFARELIGEYSVALQQIGQGPVGIAGAKPERIRRTRASGTRPGGIPASAVATPRAADQTGAPGSVVGAVGSTRRGPGGHPAVAVGHLVPSRSPHRGTTGRSGASSWDRATPTARACPCVEALEQRCLGRLKPVAVHTDRRVGACRGEHQRARPAVASQWSSRRHSHRPPTGHARASALDQYPGRTFAPSRRPATTPPRATPQARALWRCWNPDLSQWIHGEPRRASPQADLRTGRWRDTPIPDEALIKLVPMRLLCGTVDQSSAYGRLYDATTRSAKGRDRRPRVA